MNAVLPIAKKNKDIDVIRQQACNVLMQANSDGILGNVLAEMREGTVKTSTTTQLVSTGVPEQKDVRYLEILETSGYQALFNEVRCKTTEMLRQAAGDGSLTSALEVRDATVKTDTARQLVSTGVAGQPDVRYLKILEESGYRALFNEVRSKTTEMLCQAVCDGSLTSAFNDLATNATAPSEGTSPPNDLAALRLQACDVLMQASKDGSLTSVLAEVRGDKAKEVQKDMSKLRIQACDLLMQASSDGRLQQVLSEVREAAPPKTNQSATLGEVRDAALKKTNDLTMLRKQACDVLMAASQDGSLESVLDEARQTNLSNMEASGAALCNVSTSLNLPGFPELGPAMLFI
jgi:hypothetical protein